MSRFELSFSSGHDTLSVRHFSVHDALSSLFEVSLVAVSPLDDIDFETIVGQGAAFTIHDGAGGRSHGWTGICCHFEQLKAEETGLSTYVVRIVPELWLATQRQDHRIFQHLSIPAIAKEILERWHIHPVMQVDHDKYPKHDYRVQYGESDFAFLSRLLEEAGITYRFAWHPEKGTELVLADEPHRREARHGGPIQYVAEPGESARHAFITQVTAAREVKPGAYTVRDFDFRLRHDVELSGKAHHGKGVEARLEQYHYDPGALTHGHGHAHEEKAAKAIAERGLEAERALEQIVSYRSNLVDLAPGTVFEIAGHPRARIAAPHRLLAVELSVEGGVDGEVTASGRAAPAAVAHRPAKVTPRPRIVGVQSAIVVGREGEEIHTDEFGRVRVKFHWDRSNHTGDHTSCWIRVSQGWAGAGFGMMVLPRVGQEVIVGFFEGDPDQPVIVGRVYNAKNRLPYKLPENKTRSTWRSESTPGGEDAAYNEIMFEDARGAELVYIHAQRDLQKVVKNSEIEQTGADRTITVGRNRSTTVGGVDSMQVGVQHSVTVPNAAGGPSTGLEMSDGRIVATTGQATVTFDGANLSLEAAGNVTIIARDGDVVIKGGPNVKINSD